MPELSERRAKRDAILAAKKAGTLPYTDIIVEKKPSCGIITINRPSSRNSLSEQAGGTCDQLAQAFQHMADDPEMRAFILKGAGDCFCSGFDIGAFDEAQWLPREGLGKGREEEPWAALSMGFPNNPESSFPVPYWWKELWDNPKPSIALVHSYCLGAGLWIINLCDIVYASPEAVFGYPPIRYGASLTPTILPPWILGLRKTMDMTLTGRLITAQEAYDCGLITKIVPEDKLLEEGIKTAECIAKVPPMTNYMSKMTAHHYFESLGIKDTADFGMLACFMMEHCSLPGHYLDFFELVRKLGVSQAIKEQREKWGYPDEVLEKEQARLRAKRGAK